MEEIRKGEEAVLLRAVGLGYYRARINGAAVSSDLYSQLNSDFLPRDLCKTLHFVENVKRHTIYYNEYDITSLLHDGENEVSFDLGCGLFRNNDRICEGDFSYSDSLMLRFEITVGNRVIVCSDESTRYRATGVLKEGLYTGMTFDFACEKAEKNHWRTPEIVPTPDVRWLRNDCPTDRILGEVTPAEIGKRDGYVVYDCGRNEVGYLSFTADGAQEKIEVEYAELTENGDIVGIYRDIENFTQSQVDTYLHTPDGAVCAPRFNWYGFRYIRVKGKIRMPKVILTGTGLPCLTSFSSSDPVLNWYEAASRSSILHNIHMGNFTDCPHREKFAYTGDGRVISGTVMLNYDARPIFRKWFDDMEDAQHSTGRIPNTVPYTGGGGGPGPWGSACVLVPWNYYCRYGERDVLATHFSMMEKYLAFMATLTREDGLVRLKDGTPFLGDWSMPDEDQLPAEYVNTYYFLRALQIFRCICAVLGRKERYKRMKEWYQKSASAFTSFYFDPSTGSFLAGAHGADAFALDIGLGDPRTEKNLLRRYRRAVCFDTGVFGTEILLRVLGRLGAYETAYRLLSSVRYPSFGWWMKNGATTLWEDWRGAFATMPSVTSSRDHAMYGASQRYLFELLAGVCVDREGIRVSPRRVAGLRRISCSVTDTDGTTVRMEIYNRLLDTVVWIESTGQYRLSDQGKEQIACGTRRIRIRENQVFRIRKQWRYSLVPRQNLSLSFKEHRRSV